MGLGECFMDFYASSINGVSMYRFGIHGLLMQKFGTLNTFTKFNGTIL
jgi:hypothetical protein